MSKPVYAHKEKLRESVDEFRLRIGQWFDKITNPEIVQASLLCEVAVQLKRIADSLEDGLTVVEEE